MARINVNELLGKLDKKEIKEKIGAKVEKLRNKARNEYRREINIKEDKKKKLKHN